MNNVSREKLFLFFFNTMASYHNLPVLLVFLFSVIEKSSFERLCYTL